MRTISTAQAAARDSNFRAERLRVEILQGATWRDMTTLVGASWVSGARISDDVDSAHATAEVTLRREVGEWSLSPYMNTSGINRQFIYNAALVPLIAIGAQVRISVDMQPIDGQGSSSWMNIFQGKIFEFDASAGDELVIQCRDMGSDLTSAFIEKEWQYGYYLTNGTTTSQQLIRMWQPEAEFTVGEYVATTTRIGGYLRWYRCTTAGTTGTDAPIWPLAGTITSGTAVFTYQGWLQGDSGLAGWPMQDVITQLLTLKSGHTLYVPSSPGVNINPGKQERKPLMDAIREVAQRIGWDVKYKWRESTQQFELTLFQPPRTKTVPDYTFSVDEYLSVDGLRVTEGDIRNVVRVVYRDSSKPKLANAQFPIRSVAVSNSASLAKYGRLYCELGEEKTLTIDTLSEATTLANAVLSDLAEPTAVAEVTCLFFPQVELGDLYRFSANGKHFDGDTDLAVTGYTHDFAGGDAPSFRTSLTCRGKPSGGTKVWLASEAVRSGKKAAVETGLVITPTATSTARPTTAVLKLTAAADVVASPWVEHDVYVSTSSSFTPDSTTFVGTMKGDTFTITGLVPGETYYAKVVSRAPDGASSIVTEPSEAVAVTAGRADAAHLNAQVQWGRLPLNGGFETRTNATGMPDHWTLNAGALGSNVVVVEGSAARSGTRNLQLATSNFVSPDVQSGIFEVEPSTTYIVSFWAKNVSGSAIAVATLSELQTVGGVGAGILSRNVDRAASVGSWVQYTELATTSSTGRFARIGFSLIGDGTANDIHVDGFEVRRYVDPHQAFGDVSGFLNGFESYNVATQGPLAFMKEASGFVTLRGSVWRNSGAGLGSGASIDGTNIFRLPAGWRSQYTLVFRGYNWNPTGSLAQDATIVVQADGYVRIGPGGSTNHELSLSGIRFYVGP